jgi:integrase
MNSREKIPQGTAIEITFREAVALYLAAGREGRYLKALMLELIGDKRLSEIDQSLIDEVAKTILPLRASSTRNRQVYTPISAVLKFAAMQGRCAYQRIARPIQAKRVVRLPAACEVDRFVHACPPSLRRIVLFVLCTGATASEAVYLDWSQVDLNRGTVCLSIRSSSPGRNVPLDSRVIELLERLPHRSGMVFLRPHGGEYSQRRESGGQLKSAFRGACYRAGVLGITPRTLRDIWASRHWALHRDLGTLMELGGWKSERMALRYVDSFSLAPTGAEGAHSHAP